MEMDGDLGLHAAFTGRVRMTNDVRAPCVRPAIVCSSGVSGDLCCSV
jgi:hypothetical protein